MILIETIEFVVNKNRGLHILVDGQVKRTLLGCGKLAHIIVSDGVLLDLVGEDEHRDSQREKYSGKDKESYDGFGEGGEGLPGVECLLFELFNEWYLLFLLLLLHKLVTLI